MNELKFTRFQIHVAALSAIAAALALTLTLSIVFSSDKRSARSLAYTWLDAKLVDQADSIEVRGSETVTLTRKSGIWTVSADNTEYPARQTRVADFFAALTRPGSYGIRSTAESTYSSFGVDPGSSTRLVIKGGAAGNILLDLIVGKKDATGREVYLRNAADKPVRSGEDRFAAYTGGTRVSWLDLRLFPDHDAASLTVDAVTKVRVAAIDADPYTIERTRDGWSLTEGTLPAASKDSGTDSTPSATLDKSKVESFIRAILDSEADDVNTIGSGTEIDGTGNVTIDFAPTRTTGLTTKTVTITKSGEKSTAAVSGSPQSYLLADWAVKRLFKPIGELTS